LYFLLVTQRSLLGVIVEKYNNQIADSTDIQPSSKMGGAKAGDEAITKSHGKIKAFHSPLPLELRPSDIHPTESGFVPIKHLQERISPGVSTTTELAIKIYNMAMAKTERKTMITIAEILFLPSDGRGRCPRPSEGSRLTASDDLDR
jgi:hypothetical protein